MKPVSEIMFTLYQGTPQHQDWVVACLDGAWPALVGDRLATACRPERLEQGCLIIEITDPAWTDALRGMRAELCDKIRGATRHVVDQLKFREAKNPESRP